MSAQAVASSARLARAPRPRPLSSRRALSTAPKWALSRRLGTAARALTKDEFFGKDGGKELEAKAEAESEETVKDMVDPVSSSIDESIAWRVPLILADTASLDWDDIDEDGNCAGFIDYEGEYIEAMCCDYGFRSGRERMYSDSDGEIPVSGIELAIANFKREFTALRQSFRFDQFRAVREANPTTDLFGKARDAVGSAIVSAFAEADEQLEKANIFEKVPTKSAFDLGNQDTLGESISKQCDDVRQRLKGLKLSNQAVWDREHKREAEGGGVDVPFYVRGVYLSLCLLLDVLFENRPIQRFWFLETVARMPYFSYIFMLHAYETLGWWRAGAELRKVHFAEEWNELHHLQIMESLGGDQLWFDRFFAQHSAMIYFFVLAGFFFVSPKHAYGFSELIESHAVDTYGEFLDANEDLLKSIPPPLVAVRYYRQGDLYLFDEFQTGRVTPEQKRRPTCSSLYDTFRNIRDDEGEHVATMSSCQDFTVMQDLEAKRELSETYDELAESYDEFPRSYNKTKL